MVEQIQYIKEHLESHHSVVLKNKEIMDEADTSKLVAKIKKLQNMCNNIREDIKTFEIKI